MKLTGRRIVGLGFLGIAAAAVLSAPMIQRVRCFHRLEAEYASLRVGDDADAVLERIPGLVLNAGPPPETYRDFVWGETVGTRAGCVRHAVRTGEWFAVNAGYIVGFDETGRLAFKCIGNG